MDFPCLYVRNVISTILKIELKTLAIDVRIKRACTILRNSRSTYINFERRYTFQRYDSTQWSIVNDISTRCDSSQIKDNGLALLGGKGREEKRHISTRPFCPRERCRVACFITVYFFHHHAINLARICTPDRLVGIAFRAKRPPNIRCRSITTILLPRFFFSFFFCQRMTRHRMKGEERFLESWFRWSFEIE